MKSSDDGGRVQEVLARSGRSGFDPYSFDDVMISNLLQVLRLGADAKLSAPPAPSLSVRESTPARDPRTSLALWLAGLALAVSVAALATVLAG